MAARNTNTDHRSNEELDSNKLLLYRLEQVESGVKAISSKLDGQENIKKADLLEFSTRIIDRFDEKVKDVQKDIDEVKLNKAEKQEVTDLKKLFYSVTGLLGTIMVAIVIAYITTKQP